MMMTMDETERLQRCPICGCTEHKWIGCGIHWSSHKKTDKGKCEIKSR